VAKIIITPRRKVKQNSPAKRGQVNNPFCSPFEKGGKGDFMLSLDFRKPKRGQVNNPFLDFVDIRDKIRYYCYNISTKNT